MGVGKIDGNIIFEESMIHFDPVQSAKLSIYDPRQKQLIRIFPDETDSARQQFSAELKITCPHSGARRKTTPAILMNLKLISTK
ncbi:hypothetical protein EDE15_5156 [Edaphobacter aggregans]|uniref:Uncharacterized protein n=1 Tax=Edaphobacter aggregans TaxID=570835 RepID=A0A428MRE9_9BACT|nr:hypothetical protein EDE15_5156 [Edaphobacter aggregans]